MKAMIFILSLSLVQATIASNINLEKDNFNGFYSCKEMAGSSESYDQEKFLGCTEKYLYSKLNDKYKQKLSAWLLLGYKVYDLRECSEKDLYYYPYAKSDKEVDSIACMTIKIGEFPEKTGVLQFKQEDGLPKLVQVLK